MKTLIDAFDQAKTISHKGFHFLGNDLAPDSWPFQRLVEEAERRGRYFRSLGLEKGDRLAMVVPDGKAFVLSFFGAISAGIVPVPMFPPLALGRLEGYLQSSAGVLRASGARMLLTTKQAAPVLWSLISRVKNLEEILTCETMDENADQDFEAFRADLEIMPEDLCFLQFTSGSTAEPKGVVVTHENLLANANAILHEGLQINDDDRGVSWLPLYHDMGLIGFVVVPIIGLCEVYFIPTLRFLRRPKTWMEVISKYRGTITFGPNFAFGLAAKRQGDIEGLDLSGLRALGCGAEPINGKTMNRFMKKFKPAGLRPEALIPCYGMAEATLAVTFDRLDQPFRSLVIDRDAYENENKAIPYAGAEPSRAMEVVSCGWTFEGHEVAIVDDAGEKVPDGALGEIVFRGSSVVSGYYQNPSATDDAFKHGWLHTGDHGFFSDGELFISGRKKDLIILRGRNVYPQVVEWQVEQVAGVRPGNCVAFSAPGEDTEQLIIVAEAKELNGKEALAESISSAVSTGLGIKARDVVIVPAGTLSKTSSGKLQRQKTRTQYLENALGKQGSRQMGGKASLLAMARHLPASGLAYANHSIKKIFNRKK